MTKLILSALLAVTLESLPQDIQKEVDRLYGTTGRPEFKQVIDSLSSEDRAVVVSYLKSYVNDPGNWDKLAQTNALVELGDSETITREAQTFPSGSFGGESFLFRATQPKVIIALAPKMFSNEPETMIGADDAPSFRPSFEAAEANRAILAHSPYFSAAVNAWAKSWKPGGHPAQFRRVMDDWWIANKQLLYSGNYAAVQPGEPSPSKAISPIPTPSITFTPILNVAPTATPTPIPSVTPLPPTSTSSVALEVAIAVLAGVTVVFLAFLRKKR